MKVRVLMCATDAGGARNLASVAEGCRWRADFFVYGNTVTAPIFEEGRLEVQLVAQSDAAAATSLLRQIEPDVVLCGRTRHVSFDRRLIGASIAVGCPSVVVLDEWYNYLESFQNELGTLEYLPDRICCQDVMNREEAISAGVPARTLVVTGSPSLSALADRVMAFVNNPPPLPDCWRNVGDATRVLFLSETHAADYGASLESPGPMGPWLGYTEYDVRTMLGDVLARLSGKFAVVEKLHPGALTVPPLLETLAPWQTIANAPLWPILWHADRVVGMRSMALLEAAMMGHRPLSIQPNLLGQENCTAVRLNLADSARNAEEVMKWLAAPKMRASPLRPPFAAEDASANVFNIIVDLNAKSRSRSH